MNLDDKSEEYYKKYSNDLLAKWKIASPDCVEYLQRLEADFEVAKKEAEDNLAGWKRSKADYLNLQRDIEKNKQNWIDFAALGLVRDLLPVWISFSSLVANLPPETDPALAKGLVQELKMFVDFVKKHGVDKIECVGTPFDPEWHEAVGKEKALPEVASGTITKEIAPGFKLNNKLLFPPKVIVAE